MKMVMVSVTKCFDFCYGHRLPGYHGKCAEYHGHNAHVEVEVIGRDKTGSTYPTMVIDFKQLKNLVEPIIDQLDHKDLTLFFEHPVTDEADPIMEMITVPPTAEVICQWLAEQIQASLPDGVQLVRLRVSETPDSWAEWKEDMAIYPEEMFSNPVFKQMLTDFIDRRYGV